MAGYGLLTTRMITEEEFGTFIIQEGGSPYETPYGNWQIKGKAGSILIGLNPEDWPLMQIDVQRMKPFLEKLGGMAQTYISVVVGVKGVLEGLHLADIFAFHCAQHWDAVMYNLDASALGSEPDGHIYTLDELEERVVSNNAYNNDE